MYTFHFENDTIGHAFTVGRFLQCLSFTVFFIANNNNDRLSLEALKGPHFAALGRWEHVCLPSTLNIIKPINVFA